MLELIGVEVGKGAEYGLDYFRPDTFTAGLVLWHGRRLWVQIPPARQFRLMAWCRLGILASEPGAGHAEPFTAFGTGVGNAGCRGEREGGVDLGEGGKMRWCPDCRGS